MSNMETQYIAPLESFAGNRNDNTKIGVATSSSTRVDEHDSGSRLERIVYPRHRVPKRKRLDEVVANSTATTINQDDETEKSQNAPLTNDVENNAINSSTSTRQRKISGKEPSRRRSTPTIPKKEILEFVLDKLQEEDTANVFASRVDADVVWGYYHTIENYMDFSIVRENLTDRLYQSLDQFKTDVLAIFKNAMKYNAEWFVYFKKARQINELAKRYFRELKTQPSKIIKEYQKKVNKSRSRSRSNQFEFDTSSQMNEIVLPEEAYKKRETWKPLSSSTEERQIVFGNPEISYAQSLERFVKDMGETAKRVAQRKLSLLNSNFQSSNEPADNIRILNDVAGRGNSRQVQEYTNPAHVQPRNEMYLAPLLSEAASFGSTSYHHCQSGTYSPSVGYQRSFDSSRTDARGKQIISENVVDLNRSLHDQPERASFSSAARPSLRQFWSRSSSHATAPEQASPRVINPSRLSRCSNFPLDSSSNCLDGTPISFTELLLNEARRDEVAFLQEMQNSFSSSVMQPQRNIASTLENFSTRLPSNDQNWNTFSFTKYLFDEGDGSGYWEAFNKMMNSRSNYGQDQHHQGGTSRGTTKFRYI